MNNDSTKASRQPGEGLVVTKDGVRVDGKVYTAEDAAKTAAANKRLHETGGATAPAVAVKQQLFS